MDGMVKAADRSGYDRVIAPFLAANCNKCNLGVKPKGKLRTDLII